MGQKQSNQKYNYNLDEALNDPQNLQDSYAVLETMARDKELKELKKLKNKLKNDKIARDRLHMLRNSDVFKECKTLSAADCHNTYGCLPYVNEQNQAKCRNISKENFQNINVYYNAWNMMMMKMHVKRNLENADILENTKNVYVNQENVDQDAENHQDVRNVDVHVDVLVKENINANVQNVAHTDVLVNQAEEDVSKNIRLTINNISYNNLYY